MITRLNVFNVISTNVSYPKTQRPGFVKITYSLSAPDLWHSSYDFEQAVFFPEGLPVLPVENLQISEEILIKFPLEENILTF